MDAKHTPGPYRATQSASGQSDMRDDMLDWSSAVYCIAPYDEAEDSDLAGETVEEQVVCSARGRTVAEAFANARLFSAAPDLYADGAFLIARLEEFEIVLTDDPEAREFYGHVAPAIARFKTALSKASPPSLHEGEEI